MKLFLTPGWNGTYEPTTLLMILILLVPACTLLFIVLLWLDQNNKVPWLCCPLFHRRHRVLWHSSDGDFIKCSRCGRVENCL